MATPPRTVVFNHNGAMMYAELPATLDKAVELAAKAFGVPAAYGVRLSCSLADMAYTVYGADEVFLIDDTSYYYACAGKQSTVLNVHVYELGGVAAPDKPKEKKEEPKISSAEYELSCETVDGKTATAGGTVTGQLAKAGAAKYVGVLDVSSTKHSFIGKQLGPNEQLAKIVVHDAGVVRLLFRPRSMRTNIDAYAPEEKSLQVSVSVKGWDVTAAYPPTMLYPEDGRTSMSWFLRVTANGVVDLGSGTEAGGVFYELLPGKNPRPPPQVDPMAPLNPTYPDVRPSNGWCLARDLFVPHIDKVLTTLGLPPASRSAMITGWLPSVSRHAYIAYRILHKDHLEPTSQLYLCPEPDVLVRVFVLFRGVPEAEKADWNDREVCSKEMGVDWREAAMHGPAMADDGLFRVVEYGGMEVFD